MPGVLLLAEVDSEVLTSGQGKAGLPVVVGSSGAWYVV